MTGPPFDPNALQDPNNPAPSYNPGAGAALPSLALDFQRRRQTTQAPVGPGPTGPAQGKTVPPPSPTAPTPTPPAQAAQKFQLLQKATLVESTDPAQAAQLRQQALTLGQDALPAPPPSIPQQGAALPEPMAAGSERDLAAAFVNLAHRVGRAAAAQQDPQGFALAQRYFPREPLPMYPGQYGPATQPIVVGGQAPEAPTMGLGEIARAQAEPQKSVSEMWQERQASAGNAPLPALVDRAGKVVRPSGYGEAPLPYRSEQLRKRTIRDTEPLLASLAKTFAEGGIEQGSMGMAPDQLEALQKYIDAGGDVNKVLVQGGPYWNPLAQQMGESETIRVADLFALASASGAVTGAHVGGKALGAMAPGAEAGMASARRAGQLAGASQVAKAAGKPLGEAAAKEFQQAARQAMKSLGISFTANQATLMATAAAARAVNGEPPKTLADWAEIAKEALPMAALGALSHGLSMAGEGAAGRAEARGRWASTLDKAGARPAGSAPDAAAETVVDPNEVFAPRKLLANPEQGPPREAAPPQAPVQGPQTFREHYMERRWGRQEPAPEPAPRAPAAEDPTLQALLGNRADRVTLGEGALPEEPPRREVPRFSVAERAVQAPDAPKSATAEGWLKYLEKKQVSRIEQQYILHRLTALTPQGEAVPVITKGLERIPNDYTLTAEGRTLPISREQFLNQKPWIQVTRVKRGPDYPPGARAERALALSEAATRKKDQLVAAIADRLQALSAAKLSPEVTTLPEVDAALPPDVAATHRGASESDRDAFRRLYRIARSGMDNPALSRLTSIISRASNLALSGARPTEANTPLDSPAFYSGWRRAAADLPRRALAALVFHRAQGLERHKAIGNLLAGKPLPRGFTAEGALALPKRAHRVPGLEGDIITEEHQHTPSPEHVWLLAKAVRMPPGPARDAAIRSVLERYLKERVFVQARGFTDAERAALRAGGILRADPYGGEEPRWRMMPRSARAWMTAEERAATPRTGAEIDAQVAELNKDFPQREAVYKEKLRQYRAELRGYAKETKAFEDEHGASPTTVREDAAAWEDYRDRVARRESDLEEYEEYQSDVAQYERYQEEYQQYQDDYAEHEEAESRYEDWLDEDPATRGPAPERLPEPDYVSEPDPPREVEHPGPVPEEPDVPDWDEETIDQARGLRHPPVKPTAPERATAADIQEPDIVDRWERSDFQRQLDRMVRDVETGLELSLDHKPTPKDIAHTLNAAVREHVPKVWSAHSHLTEESRTAGTPREAYLKRAIELATRAAPYTPEEVAGIARGWGRIRAAMRLSAAGKARVERAKTGKYRAEYNTESYAAQPNLHYQEMLVHAEGMAGPNELLPSHFDLPGTGRGRGAQPKKVDYWYRGENVKFAGKESHGPTEEQTDRRLAVAGAEAAYNRWLKGIEVKDFPNLLHVLTDDGLIVRHPATALVAKGIQEGWQKQIEDIVPKWAAAITEGTPSAPGNPFEWHAEEPHVRVDSRRLANALMDYDASPEGAGMAAKQMWFNPQRSRGRGLESLGNPAREALHEALRHRGELIEGTQRPHRGVEGPVRYYGGPAPSLTAEEALAWRPWERIGLVSGDTRLHGDIPGGAGRYSLQGYISSTPERARFDTEKRLKDIQERYKQDLDGLRERSTPFSQDASAYAKAATRDAMAEGMAMGLDVFHWVTAEASAERGEQHNPIYKEFIPSAVAEELVRLGFDAKWYFKNITEPLIGEPEGVRQALLKAPWLRWAHKLAGVGRFPYIDQPLAKKMPPPPTDLEASFDKAGALKLAEAMAKVQGVPEVRLADPITVRSDTYEHTMRPHHKSNRGRGDEATDHGFTFNVIEYPPGAIDRAMDPEVGIRNFSTRKTFEVGPAQGSAAVEGAAYKESTGKLTIQFKGGARYVYTGVTPEEWEAFRTAESKGKAMNVIKQAHPKFRKVPPPKPGSIAEAQQAREPLEPMGNQTDRATQADQPPMPPRYSMIERGIRDAEPGTKQSLGKWIGYLEKRYQQRVGEPQEGAPTASGIRRVSPEELKYFKNRMPADLNKVYSREELLALDPVPWLTEHVVRHTLRGEKHPEGPGGDTPFENTMAALDAHSRPFMEYGEEHIETEPLDPAARDTEGVVGAPREDAPLLASYAHDFHRTVYGGQFDTEYRGPTEGRHTQGQTRWTTHQIHPSIGEGTVLKAEEVQQDATNALGSIRVRMTKFAPKVVTPEDEAALNDDEKNALQMARQKAAAKFPGTPPEDLVVLRLPHDSSDAGRYGLRQHIVEPGKPARSATFNDLAFSVWPKADADAAIALHKQMWKDELDLQMGRIGPYTKDEAWIRDQARRLVGKAVEGGHGWIAWPNGTTMAYRANLAPEPTGYHVKLIEEKFPAELRRVFEEFGVPMPEPKYYEDPFAYPTVDTEDRFGKQTGVPGASVEDYEARAGRGQRVPEPVRSDFQAMHAHHGPDLANKPGHRKAGAWVVPLPKRLIELAQKHSFQLRQAGLLKPGASGLSTDLRDYNALPAGEPDIQMSLFSDIVGPKLSRDVAQLDLAPLKASVVNQSMQKSLASGKSGIGATVKSEADLVAMYATSLFHTTVERSAIVGTSDAPAGGHTVRYSTAMTSNRTDSTPIIASLPAGTSVSRTRAIRLIADAWKEHLRDALEAGVDKLWSMHSHPTAGHMASSPADRLVTRLRAQAFDLAVAELVAEGVPVGHIQYMGERITDHDKFVVLQPIKEPGITDEVDGRRVSRYALPHDDMTGAMPRAARAEKLRFKTPEPGMEHPVLGTDITKGPDWMRKPEAFLKATESLRDGSSAMTTFVTPHMLVNGLGQLPEAFFDLPLKRQRRLLTKRVNATASRHILVVTDGASQKIVDGIARLIKANVIAMHVDAQHPSGVGPWGHKTSEEWDLEVGSASTRAETYLGSKSEKTIVSRQDRKVKGERPTAAGLIQKAKDLREKMGDKARENEMARELTLGTSASVPEALVAVWKAGLLTGVGTHLNYALGTGIYQALEAGVTQPVARFWDAIFDQTLFRGIDVGPVRDPSMRGHVEAAKGWVKAARNVMSVLKGHDRKLARGWDLSRQRDLGPKWPILGGLSAGVFRSVEALASLNLGAAQGRAAYEVARLAARREGLTPRAKGWDARVDHWLKHPTAAMDAQASLLALVATYQNANPLSDLISGIGKPVFRGKWGGSAALFDMAIPFRKIPTNSSIRGLEYTGPIGALKTVGTGLMRRRQAKEFRASRAEQGDLFPQSARVEAEDLIQKSKREMGDLAARATVGAVLVAIGALLAAKGLISGMDQDELDKAEGIPRNSIKLGNTWYGLLHLGPLAVPLMTGAQAVRAYVDDRRSALKKRRAETELALPGGAVTTEEGARAAVGGYARSAMGNFVHRSFLGGAAQQIDAIANPSVDEFDRMGAGLAGSVIPTGVAQYAAAADATQRRPRGLKEYVQNRIPGQRESLPEDLDAFGRTMQKGGNVFARFVTASALEQGKANTLTRELRRLGLTPAAPSTQVPQEDGAGTPLTLDRQQTNQARALTGPQVARVISHVMQNPVYKTLPKEEQALVMDRAQRAAVSRVMHSPGVTEWLLKPTEHNTPRVSLDAESFVRHIVQSYEAQVLAREGNQVAKRVVDLSMRQSPAAQDTLRGYLDSLGRNPPERLSAGQLIGAIRSEWQKRNPDRRMPMQEVEGILTDSLFARHQRANQPARP